jgi:hypothetical protein
MPASRSETGSPTFLMALTPNTVNLRFELTDNSVKPAICFFDPMEPADINLTEVCKEGRAAFLNKSLEPIEAPGGAPLARSKSRPGRLIDCISSFSRYLHPQGVTHNDNTVTQRTMNIVTSLPLLAIGFRMLRRHRSAEGQQFALSMMAVGAAATAYHASSGKSRKVLRKLDYWTIAASSSTMMKALWADRKWAQKVFTSALCLVPFRPFHVSAAHTVLMQGEFARLAVKNENIRPHFRRHLVAASAGAVAFLGEDFFADRGFGHVHALWHILAAASVLSAGALIEHKEDARLARKGISRRHCHDSMTSLLQDHVFTRK